jgi:hypothetical protein
VPATDLTEWIWADNDTLPGQRIYVQRQALFVLAASGWREGPAEPEPDIAELDAQLLEQWQPPEPVPEPSTAELDAQLLAPKTSDQPETAPSKSSRK